MDKSLPRQRRGAVIRARTINRPIEEIERELRSGVSAPLALTDSIAGRFYRVDEVPEKYARITTNLAAGSYGFQVIAPAASGGWADHVGSDASGADPAYEFNGNPNVPAGTRVRIRRAGGSWRFQLGPCDSTGQTLPVPQAAGFAARREASLLDDFAAGDEVALATYYGPQTTAGSGKRLQPVPPPPPP